MIMRYLLLILAICNCSTAYGANDTDDRPDPTLVREQHHEDPTAQDGWRILQPNDIHVDAWKDGTVHDPYLAPIDKTLTYGGAFETDFDICTYRGYGLYMKNSLHMDEGYDQHIVAAGWQYEVGATVWRSGTGQGVQLFHQHHSQHELDDASESGDHYPVYDRNGIRLIIYSREFGGHD